MPMQKISYQSQGFALIATVLSLLGFSLVLSLALTQITFGTIATTEVVRSGAQALATAEGCVEGLLNEIRADPSFSEGSFTTSAGICNVDLRQDESDNTRYTLHVSAAHGSATRGVSAEVTRTETQLQLVSWSEE